jgi:hypothetical protein
MGRAPDKPPQKSQASHGARTSTFSQNSDRATAENAPLAGDALGSVSLVTYRKDAGAAACPLTDRFSIQHRYLLLTDSGAGRDRDIGGGALVRGRGSTACSAVAALNGVLAGAGETFASLRQGKTAPCRTGAPCVR